jgi:hypothetical protein
MLKENYFAKTGWLGRLVSKSHSMDEVYATAAQ